MHTDDRQLSPLVTGEYLGPLQMLPLQMVPVLILFSLPAAFVFIQRSNKPFNISNIINRIDRFPSIDIFEHAE